MACSSSKFFHQMSLIDMLPTIMVAMTVSSEHPLLKLKRKLDWAAIREIIVKHLAMSGRNVDAGPGCPLDVNLYVPVLVLMLIKHLDSRHMETLLSENAPARVFIGRDNSKEMQVRDHSNIARIMDSLGEEGVKALNALIVKEAVAFGFADPSRLSGDTTAQELPIGHPHEAGILKGLAERCGRAFSKLVKKGKAGLTEAVSRCKAIVKQAKAYHLFAKGKEAKDKILHAMVSETEELLRDAEQILSEAVGESGRVIRNACGRLQDMISVGKKLLPQILQWLNTGVVAKGKIIHSGIEKARVIVRNKAGKAVEFGLQYLLCRLGRGYVFGELIEKPTGEVKMPNKCLETYRGIFGQEKTPEMFTYDRGGHSEGNVKGLQKEGVAKVGIQPKGQAPWSVDETDRPTVLSERGMMEGTIGTLKSTPYGFNKPKERRYSALRASGQKSMISCNLNKMMRDLMRQEKEMKAVG